MTRERWRLDHLVVAAADLNHGADRMAGLLGMPPAAGGRHPTMGTWNRLWGLGGPYLEVIAVDPHAPNPGRPRWFGLDDPGMQARLARGPRLVAWVAEPPDLDAAAAMLPLRPGRAERHHRDALHWTLTVPQDGHPPDGGTIPMLIRWPEGVEPPGRALPARGISLRALEIHSPHAAALARLPLPEAVHLHPGAPALSASIALPDGRRVQL